MKKLLFAFALALLGGAFALPASAQTVSVASACSAQTLNTGYGNGTLIILQNGDLCINGGSLGTVTVSNAFNLEATQQQVKADLDAIAGAIGQPIPAGSSIIGKVGIDQTTQGTTNGVVNLAATVGGATSYGLQTTASTNSTSVKASAGVLYAINVTSTSTTVMYLRMYDSSTAPTCSSSTNFSRSWAIPPAASSGLVGGAAYHIAMTGIQFNNGIAFCVTGGASSTDNTNATTGGLVNLDYK